MTDLKAHLQTRLGDFALDFTLDTSSGGVTGLFGASGSGKTTVLRCLAGLKRAEQGVVRINGVVWQDDAAGVFVPPHLRGVGYVSQDADLFPHLSVRGNFEYAQNRVPAHKHSLPMESVVSWLALETLLERSVSNLSGGERQRVAIGRALLTNPSLLLMDEPVSALDEPARREVLSYLESVFVRVEIPTVYVSHSLTEVTRLSDRLVWIVEGKVREAGPISQVLGRLDFARWWGEEAGVVIDGEVLDHDSEFHLTTVATNLGKIIVHQRPEACGNRIRLRINGRDVSIGLTAQSDSSILNELPLTVLEIADLGPSDCLLRLGNRDSPEPVLLSRITRKSLVQLGVEPGLRVFARVKSVAVLD